MTRRQLAARRAAAVRWGRPEADDLGRQMGVERVIIALRDYRRRHGEFEPAAKRRLLLWVDGLPHPRDWE